MKMQHSKQSKVFVEQKVMTLFGRRSDYTQVGKKAKVAVLKNGI